MNKKVKPFLLTRSLQPENQESPIHFLRKSETPIKYFYRRNHFPYPHLNQTNYWLQVINKVEKPRFIALNDLLSMPSKSLYIPLECAGNKRANFSPKVFGEQWENGAISQGKKPVTTLNVNSIIQKPLDYSILEKGIQKIEGIAWTGEGSIAEVQISIDNGETWKKANLTANPQQAYSWVKWSLQWGFEKKGEYTIFSKAIDTSGRMQPDNAFWNRKGYGFNEVAKHHISVQ